MRTPSWAALGGTLALLLVSLLVPSAASAARGHQFKETFGTPCTELVCGPEELKEPSAVAVNEATGEVYVLDQGNARVERFDGATGAFLGSFNGSGSFEPDPGVTEPTAPAEAGPLSYLGGAQNVQVSGIAVDNSCSLEGLTGIACEEADPSNEDVYVVDPGHNVVDKFRSNGEYLGQITEAAGETLAGLGGATVDSSGSLWISEERNVGGFNNGAFYRFSSALTNPYAGEQVARPSSSDFFGPGFSVDSEGNFYARAKGIQGRTGYLVEKLGSTGNQLIAELDPEDSSGIAVDLKTDNSFLDNLTTVAVFTSAGSELERLGKEAGADHLTEGAGLAADATFETIYVADSGAGRVVVFGPQQPKAPEVSSEGVLNISSSAATLEAELNPRSETGEGETSYRFQYGPCAGALSTCAASPFPFETATGQLAPDFEIHRVSALLAGLQPRTLYHYRLFAENGQGETTGPEKTFTTQPTGGSILLPDSRQWQLVSPPDKLGALIEPMVETGIIQAAADGRAISYIANAATEPQPQGTGASGGVQILSTRAQDSWLSQDLATPHDVAIGPPGQKEYRAFSEDLAYSFVNPFGRFTPSISAEATGQTAFRRTDFLDGDPGRQCRATSMPCYTPLVTAAPGVANVPEGTPFGQQTIGALACPFGSETCGPEFVEASPDGSHVILKSTVALTAAAIPYEEGKIGSLYEWDAAAPPAQQLRLVSVLPGAGEQPAAQPYLGWVGRHLRDTVSADGSRVIFSEGGVPSHGEGSEHLFLRDTERGKTIQLDAGEGCPACESGGARYELASVDDSRVLFTDVRHLTADSGAEETSPGGGKADLYQCQIAETGGSGSLGCDLTDLTPETATGESADILGAAIGASEDASSVYFVANGVLASNVSQGQHAEPGDCVTGTPNDHASCNLYLSRDGQITFIAALSGFDENDWSNGLAELPAHVSPDGTWLAFMSQRPLTGYDNRDLATGKPAAEVYLYSAAADHLVCASCDPTGARPRAVEYANLTFGRGGLVGGPRASWPFTGLVAANLTGWEGDEELGQVTHHQPRYLSDSGRLFFNTVNALVPQDANGTQDVYQYEPPAVGDCTTSSSTFGERSGGCVSLISSGTSAQESAFLDASESGGDVFFLTSARLSPLDVDSARDVYDAHVCTGSVPCLPEPPPSPPACSGDACQQPAVPPTDQTPGSLSFNGAGNVTECPKGKVKQKGRCVRKKASKKKHHKKKSHKKSNRTNDNRGGAK